MGRLHERVYSCDAFHDIKQNLSAVCHSRCLAACNRNLSDASHFLLLNIIPRTLPSLVVQNRNLKVSRSLRIFVSKADALCHEFLVRLSKVLRRSRIFESECKAYIKEPPVRLRSGRIRG
jgi:hypothetical protein